MSFHSDSKKQTTPLNEILDWSVGRPDWQRDALRRIIENRSLSDTDLQELIRICRMKHQVDASDQPAISPIHLARNHLPASGAANESVSLVSVGNLKNVNRLPEGRTLPFGAEVGLTVLYGDNGAGKSGYARIIKKACRARGAQPIIRPNAFSSATPAKATAEIKFKINGNEISENWIDGVSADARLANIYVFDSSSAGHYVSEESAAAFTPYGLDVLPLLSKVCDAIDNNLKLEIAQKKQSVNDAVASWKYDATTKVGKLIANLSGNTKEADVIALAGLDENQIQRLHDLREAFKSDPRQKAKLTRAVAARLELFEKAIATASANLADEKISILQKKFDDAKLAADAAKTFSSGRFGDDYLAGTGAHLWRTLWNAAREYSVSSAYKDRQFPYVSVDAKCVLCQQKIDQDAASRLNAFEAFITDKSQQLATKAETELVESINRFSLMGPLESELSKVDADLVGLSDEQRLLVSNFVSNADARLDLLKKSLSTRVWSPSVSLADSPEQIIVALQAALEARAVMEESAHDPEVLKQLIAEGAELGAKEWLLGVKEVVLKQIHTYKTIQKLDRCKKDVATAQITMKSSELTEQFVTSAFQQRFINETKLLGLKTLNVSLEPINGKKGETRFALRLVSTTSQKVVDVASEGEQRCIALAAFLSELSQASHRSALVFDDPVSSLDHWHREKIASRLVNEASQRQVIIFTHDVVFLNDLLSFTKKAGAQAHVLSLEWRDGLPGSYFEGLPWDSKSPKECLDELEKTQKMLLSKWNPQPSAENIAAMRHAYSRLRSTIERIVEVELLGGIVGRFESQVNAGRVNCLIGIAEKECDEIKRLLQKCHKITEAHAPGKNDIPDPAEFLDDLNDSRSLIVDIRAAKKITLQ